MQRQRQVDRHRGLADPALARGHGDDVADPRQTRNSGGARHGGHILLPVPPDVAHIGDLPDPFIQFGLHLIEPTVAGKRDAQPDVHPLLVPVQFADKAGTEQVAAPAGRLKFPEYLTNDLHGRSSGCMDVD